jgi:hypothetical protein
MSLLWGGGWEKQKLPKSSNTPHRRGERVKGAKHWHTSQISNLIKRFIRGMSIRPSQKPQFPLGKFLIYKFFTE